MTDMFTIMLVFLLQSYNTAEIMVAPDTGQNLPLSNSEANPVMALQVSVTKNEVKIEDKVVMSFNQTDFNRSDIDPNDTNFVVPLFQALDRIAKAEKTKADQYEADKAAGTVKKEKGIHGHLVEVGKPNPGILEGKIIVKADQGLPYGVLRKVMYTASMAGFPKMKMATLVGN